MDILFYMFRGGISGTEKSHIIEVMNNLTALGVTVRFADGRPYGPIDIGGGNGRGGAGRSRIKRLKGWLLDKPLGGEAMLLRLFFTELKIFTASLVTVIRGRPDVIYRRHGTVFDSSYLLGAAFRIPVVKEVNGIVADELDSKKLVRGLSLRFVGVMERFNFRHARKTIVVTSNLKQVLQKDYGVPAAKIEVVPNGANTELFRPMDVYLAREQLGMRREASYLCFSGALVTWMCLDGVLKSLPLILERCPDARLVLVGDGERMSELVELAGRLGVRDSVEFPGMVPYGKVPVYINASDICLMPTARTYRNERLGASPLKLGEYMACAKPVIASRMINGLECVQEQQAGYLVDPNDPAEIAAAAIRLIQDGEERRRMGENARRYALATLSWRSVSERIERICHSVLRNGTEAT